MRLHTAWLLLFAGSVLAADAPKKEAAVKKELESIQGKWIIASAETRAGSRRAVSKATSAP